jgi:hypothetical protein
MSYNQGRLEERTTRSLNGEGNEDGTTFSYTAYGQLEQATTSQGWNIAYDYIESGTESGKLDTIEVNNGSPTVIKKVEYTYFGEVSDPAADDNVGSNGDLVQVKVTERASDGSWCYETPYLRV